MNILLKGYLTLNTRIPETIGQEVCSHAEQVECFTCGETIWVGEKKYVHSILKWMCQHCYEWEEGDDEKFLAELKERLRIMTKGVYNPITDSHHYEVEEEFLGK